MDTTNTSHSPEAQSPSSVRRLRMRLEGEVQGVGFRWTARMVANELGLTGSVQSVEPQKAEPDENKSYSAAFAAAIK